MKQETVEPRFKKFKQLETVDFSSALQLERQWSSDEKMELADRNDGFGLRPVDGQESKIRIRRHSFPGKRENFSVTLFRRKVS